MMMMMMTVGEVNATGHEKQETEKLNARAVEVDNTPTLGIIPSSSSFSSLLLPHPTHPFTHTHTHHHTSHHTFSIHL